MLKTKGPNVMRKNEWDYIIKDDGFIKLMKYTGNDDVVKIPSTIDDVMVTKIGANVFNNRVIRKLYIPESIEYIEKYFFKYTNVSEEIAVAEGNLIFSSISGIVYDKDKSVLLYCPKSRFPQNLFQPKWRFPRNFHIMKTERRVKTGCG